MAKRPKGGRGGRTDETQKAKCGCIRGAPGTKKHKGELKMEKSEKVKMEIAKALAGKVSQQEIAERLGVSQTSSSQFDPIL